MVNVNVIGRLGNDSELVNGKNGQFVSFRMATDEFKNGEKGTAWFRVNYNGERALKIQEWLKKGKLINVVGTETVGIYTDKNGQPQISRDINANHVEFVSVGSGQTQSDTATETTVEPVTGKVEKPKKATVPPQSNEEVLTFDDTDDLPF